MAASFRSQSESITTKTNALKADMETLQSGDWIGQGAQAFYKEMSDMVLPTMQRLQRALAEASRITQQISQIMKAAEDEASSCFHV
jgi:WXG100 family type VII secretion target